MCVCVGGGGGGGGVVGRFFEGLGLAQKEKIPRCPEVGISEFLG